MPPRGRCASGPALRQSQDRPRPVPQPLLVWIADLTFAECVQLSSTDSAAFAIRLNGRYTEFYFYQYNYAAHSTKHGRTNRVLVNQ